MGKKKAKTGRDTCCRECIHRDERTINIEGALCKIGGGQCHYNHQRCYCEQPPCETWKKG